jgi:hypothetical protein
VEAEGDVVRDPGTGDLPERGSVQDEQERGPGRGIEHDREQHSGVFPVGARGGHEDGFARVGAWFRPGDAAACFVGVFGIG